MTYSKDNQIRKYVQGYGFMSFAKNFGRKYGKKFLKQFLRLNELKIQHLNLIRANMTIFKKKARE